MSEKSRRFTEAQNAAFAAMSPREKGVQIAQDVIGQLKLGRIQAERGVYLEGVSTEKGQIFVSAQADGAKELSEVFGGMTVCHACAIGSLFVCAVERLDKLRVSDFVWLNYDPTEPCSLTGGQSRMRDYLGCSFDTSQLQDIENAFEGDGFCLERNAGDRMIRIMENIVRNGGEFDDRDPIDALAREKLYREPIPTQKEAHDEP